MYMNRMSNPWPVIAFVGMLLILVPVILLALTDIHMGWTIGPQMVGLLLLVGTIAEA